MAGTNPSSPSRTSTAPAKKQKTEHAMVEIVDKPTGDMVIRVGKGDDTGLVRVHKTFLTVVSPVFRAMLTGGFSESTRVLDEKDPLVLDDDDHEAFIDFCKIVHHQSVGQKRTIDCLIQVAFIADKYACAETVLQPLLQPFRILVDPIIRDNHLQLVDPSVKTVIDLILLSRIAKDSDLLWQSSCYAAVNFSLNAIKNGWNPNLCRIAPGVAGKFWCRPSKISVRLTWTRRSFSVASRSSGESAGLLCKLRRREASMAVRASDRDFQ